MVNQIHYGRDIPSQPVSSRNNKNLTPLGHRKTSDLPIARTNFDSIISTLNVKTKLGEKLRSMSNRKSPKRTHAIKMRLNKESEMDVGDAETMGKVRFMKDNKKRKNLGSADNGYNVSMSKLPQTKFIISKAEPLYLKKKSLNDVDSDLAAITAQYKAAINKVVKTITRDV